MSVADEEDGGCARVEKRSVVRFSSSLEAVAVAMVLIMLKSNNSDNMANARWIEGK
jgi:hypothetical protein